MKIARNFLEGEENGSNRCIECRRQRGRRADGYESLNSGPT